MRRDRVIQLVALGVLALFLAAQGVLATWIAASAGRNRLVYADSAEEGDPPEVALGIAMGAFRGVFVNFLWIRANTLKEAGKYHEAIDLARTITRLQPRFPKVWAFHAWNLSYNISVVTQTPQERWQWVQSGVKLLRDQGIPANPADILLHKELAWIYMHKIQGYMDDAHKYYKQMHAIEWTVVMGAPPKIPLGERAEPGALVKLYVERWLTPIADAHETIEEVYAVHPEARELVQRLRAEVGLEPDTSLLEAHEQLKAIVSGAEAMGAAPAWLHSNALVKIVNDPKYRNAAPVLLRHIRKRVLTDEYHMEPGRMIRYTQKYGPLDWRHPAAHAVYWSARGSEEALLRVTEKNRKNYDFLNTDRITIQALQELFRTGWIQFDIANPRFYQTLPHADFIPAYGAVLRELSDRSEFDSETRIYSFYAAGYENFLRDSIRFLYRRGDKGLAGDYYRTLREWPGLNQTNPELKDQLTQPLDDFVRTEITRDQRLTNPGVALQEISGSLAAAYLWGLLAGDDAQFRTNFEYAQTFHARFQREQSFRTPVAGQEGRMGFKPFPVMAAIVFAGLVEDAGIPHGPVMYRRAPSDLQARAYVVLSEGNLRAQLDAGAAQGANEPFEAWFPRPAGITDAALNRFRAEMIPDQGDAPPGTGIAPK